MRWEGVETGTSSELIDVYSVSGDDDDRSVSPIRKLFIGEAAQTDGGHRRRRAHRSGLQTLPAPPALIAVSKHHGSGEQKGETLH